MKRNAALAVAFVLFLVPSTAAGASSEAPPGVDQVGSVGPGGTFAWTGSTATGFNNYYWDPAGAGPVGPFEPQKCTKDVATYCDVILLEYSNPLTAAEIAAGKTEKTKNTTITIDNFTPTGGPVTDYDLFAYASDANGTLGEVLDSDGSLTNTTRERVAFPVTTTVGEPSVWVLIRVVYYQVVNGSYKGNAAF